MSEINRINDDIDVILLVIIIIFIVIFKILIVDSWYIKYGDKIKIMNEYLSEFKESCKE